jgi:hypothetical protein
VCQVPTIKSVGSLIWAVIVGDLVLLQALWKVFIWNVDFYLKKNDSHAMLCEGCLETKGSFQGDKTPEGEHEAGSTDGLVGKP